MTRQERAKQFMPFSALKGFEKALEQKEKIVVQKRELSEYQLSLLDEKLKQVKVKDIVSVEHYESGEYIKTTGMVSNIDLINRTIKIVNLTIKFDDITNIQGDGIKENFN